MNEYKIGDVLEYKASDMLGSVWGKDITFKCRVVSLIYKAGKLVGRGILWESDENNGRCMPKILLGEDMFGRAATRWADKCTKI